MVTIRFTGKLRREKWWRNSTSGDSGAKVRANAKVSFSKKKETSLEIQRGAVF